MCTAHLLHASLLVCAKYSRGACPCCECEKRVEDMRCVHDAPSPSLFCCRQHAPSRAATVVVRRRSGNICCLRAWPQCRLPRVCKCVEIGSSSARCLLRAHVCVCAHRAGSHRTHKESASGGRTVAKRGQQEERTCPLPSAPPLPSPPTLLVLLLFLPPSPGRGVAMHVVYRAGRGRVLGRSCAHTSISRQSDPYAFEALRKQIEARRAARASLRLTTLGRPGVRQVSVRR